MKYYLNSFTTAISITKTGSGRKFVLFALRLINIEIDIDYSIK